MMRRLFAPVVVLFAVLLVATPAAAHHTTPYQVDTIFYYNGCPRNGTAVGVRANHCDGGVTTFGTQNGHWKEVEVEDCYIGPGTPPTDHNHTHYYEKCDGVWVEVTPEAFFEGTCSC
jgi:hypothetical protein